MDKLLPKQDMPNDSRVIDVTGQQFNDLHADYYVGQVAFGKRLLHCWQCTCTCGTTCIAAGSYMRQQRVKNCGGNAHPHNSTVHGFCPRGKAIPEYWIWMAMKNRCNNPKDKNYHRYGGRGITVCERWQQSFPNFLADMGHRPNPSLTLDRLDNDKGYCPKNCAWRTRKEQQRNLRTTTMVEYEGKTVALNDLADAHGIHERTVKGRLKMGFALDEALTMPVRTEPERDIATGQFLPFAP
jgi:hypothetical protein